MIFRVLIAVLGLAASAQAQLKFQSVEQFVAVSPGEGRAISHFNFTNAGNYHVKILGTDTTCGCTAAVTDKRVYAPGEKGQIEVTFKTANRHGMYGEPIAVKTDDPQVKEINLHLRILVRDALELQPMFLYWAAGEAPGEKKIHVSVTDGFDVKGLNASASDANATVRVETLKPGREYNIAVTPHGHSFKCAVNIQPEYLQPGSNAPKEFVARLRVY